MGNNYLLDISIGMTIVSIAFFNFTGVTITKQLTATTRCNPSHRKSSEATF
jgi:hypothetical protein